MSRRFSGARSWLTTKSETEALPSLAVFQETIFVLVEANQNRDCAFAFFCFDLEEPFNLGGSHSVLRQTFFYYTFIRTGEIYWRVAENDPRSILPSI